MVKKDSIRTCIVCKKKMNKWDLVRFVLDESGRFTEDQKMIKPGRGAYVCRDHNCRLKFGMRGFQ
jgi:predicted RNA-binding protein YlxR (DUF448 family)